VVTLPAGYFSKKIKSGTKNNYNPQRETGDRIPMKERKKRATPPKRTVD